MRDLCRIRPVYEGLCKVLLPGCYSRFPAVIPGFGQPCATVLRTIGNIPCLTTVSDGFDINSRVERVRSGQKGAYKPGDNEQTMQKRAESSK